MHMPYPITTNTYVPLDSELEEIRVGVESVKASTHEHIASAMAVSSSIQGAMQPSNHVSPGVCV